MQKNFIVAGGSSGIGKELVLQLKADGHHVIVLSRTKKDLPDDVEFHSVDFSNDELELPAISCELSGIAYMPGSINLKPYRSVKKDELMNDFRLNVVGALECIKKYQGYLSKDAASIVLMSTVAVQTGMPYHSIVSASKGAVEGLTRSLAAEMTPKVRVNAIAPSLTNTPLAEKLLNTEDKIQSSKDRHPLKTIGNATHIAEMAKFLLSDSSQFISGQIIHIDGGMSALR